MAAIVGPSPLPEDAEAEPVVIDVGLGEITMTLDDGTAVSFDEAELREAIAAEDSRAA